MDGTLSRKQVNQHKNRPQNWHYLSPFISVSTSDERSKADGAREMGLSPVP